MDSLAIANELETICPSPSLHLDAPSTKATREIVDRLLPRSRGLWVASVPANLLNPKSAEFFERTRAVRFKMSLKEYAAENGGEMGWEKTAESLKELGDLLREEDGPFVLGKTGECHRL